MDGPNGSQCLHRGQIPAADQEHVKTPVSSRPCVLPGLRVPEADSPAQTVMVAGLGQRTRLSTTARDKVRTGCTTGDNTAPVPGWSNAAGRLCAAPGMAAKPPRR